MKYSCDYSITGDEAAVKSIQQTSYKLRGLAGSTTSATTRGSTLTTEGSTMLTGRCVK